MALIRAAFRVGSPPSLRSTAEPDDKADQQAALDRLAAQEARVRALDVQIDVRRRAR
jgi:hypothetical protein